MAESRTCSMIATWHGSIWSRSIALDCDIRLPLPFLRAIAALQPAITAVDDSGPWQRSTGAGARAIISAFVQPTPRRGSRCAGPKGQWPMFSKLKAAWNRLAGPGSDETDAVAAPAVEYNGYRIRAAPFRKNGLYQTAGII